MTCALCVTDYDEDECHDQNCNCLESVHTELRYGGETKKMGELKLENFASGEATKLAHLDEKPSFTIVGVESSDYEDQDGVHAGVRIETKESFVIEGTPFSKFYTTRTAIVSKFYNKEKTPSALTTAILAGGELKVKTVSKKSKSGRSYFDFEQA